MDKINEIIYQVWPRSFKDSNNDGIGDIQGIISKLDYLSDLGITMLWLSPIYCSPNTDYGYDVSDYYNINPEFGTMVDFDELLASCKKRNIKLMMDLVANHTSDQHIWFQSCLEDIDSPYRDYYLFKEGVENKEPNNWISVFGGSAWQKDPLKDNSWYLTTFTPHQCDLNWKNPNVRKEIVNIMRFWLDKGVSGFRLDVINTIAKEEGLPSYRPEKKGYQFAKEYITNQPLSHEYIQEMMSSLNDYDFITVGEGMMVDKEACALYAGEGRGELSMMIMFDLHLQDCGPLGKYDFRTLYRWNISTFKKIIYSWQLDMQKNNYHMGNYMNNHDQPRSISRFGNDKEYREASAKAFALMTLTLKGTPFIYQGEEIGMTNCTLQKNQWRDFEAINVYETLQTMMHLPKAIAEKVVKRMTRDNARTCMQWDSSNHAGFTSGKPWITVNPNYPEINVEKDISNNKSIYHAYRQLIDLRKKEIALSDGDFQVLLENHKQILAYSRNYKDKTFIVLINLSSKKVNYSLDLKGELLFNNCLFYEKNKLNPYQALLIKVT